MWGVIGGIGLFFAITGAWCDKLCKEQAKNKVVSSRPFYKIILSFVPITVFSISGVILYLSAVFDWWFSNIDHWLMWATIFCMSLIIDWIYHICDPNSEVVDAAIAQQKEEAKQILQAQADAKKSSYFANIYVMAWEAYQEIEPKIPRAWLFLQPDFMKRVQVYAIEQALRDAVQHSINFHFFVRTKQNSQSISEWVVAVAPSSIDIKTAASDLYEVLPCLQSVFDWKFAEAADVQYVQDMIPSATDPRVRYATRMAWDNDELMWCIMQIPR